MKDMSVLVFAEVHASGGRGLWHTYRWQNEMTAQKGKGVKVHGKCQESRIFEV
jgi:hypothetical protein